MIAWLLNRYVPKKWKNLLILKKWDNCNAEFLFLQNAKKFAHITIGLIIVWMILSIWFFREFNPFSYLIINKNFTAPLLAGFPLFIYAFLSVQIRWLRDADEDEDNPPFGNNLAFKYLISISAGFFEELIHRGLLIYLGLIVIYISNEFVKWWLPLVIVIFFLRGISRLRLGFMINLGGAVAALWVAKLLYDIIPENLILMINGFMFAFILLTASDLKILAALLTVLGGLALGRMLWLINQNTRLSISPLEFILSVALLAGFGVYAIPLGMQSILHMPIIPANADSFTALLYISAVLWSNSSFMKGHKYQGYFGMMNSYILGLYMFYIAFTFGLLYAIIIHALFNITLFTLEHLQKKIKTK